MQTGDAAKSEGDQQGGGSDVTVATLQVVQQAVVNQTKTSNIVSDDIGSSRSSFTSDAQFSIRIVRRVAEIRQPVQSECRAGQRHRGKTEPEALGVVGSTREDLGSHMLIKGQGGAPGSEKDASYAAQSRFETVNGTDRADEIFADDPDKMPPGTFVRLIDVSVSMQTRPGGRSRRVSSACRRFLHRERQTGRRRFLVDLPKDSPKNFQLELRYVVPLTAPWLTPRAFSTPSI
jgi:hypothetical protein